MSFYRYTLETPDIGYIRSLTPLGIGAINKHSFFSYRYYTSHYETANDNYKVISLGYERSWKGKKKVSGNQNRYVIRYVIKGTVSFCGQPVPKGCFFFSTPSDKYTIETVSSSAEIYYIGIAGVNAESLMKNAGFFSIPKINPCPFIDSIPGIFYSPLFEAHPSVDTNFYLMSVFFVLLSMHKPYNADNINSAVEISYIHYNQALSYIQEYYMNGIGAKDVAEFLHLSPSYLRAIFAKHCKYSLREYIIRKRIEHSAFLLSHEKYSIKEAAHAIGYNDYALFSRIFKKYTGMSPQAYKETNHAFKENYSSKNTQTIS